MADAPPRTELSRADVAGADVIGPGFRLRRETGVGIVKVQLYRSEGQEAVSAVIGSGLPAPGRQIRLAHETAFASIGPAEWLLVGPAAPALALAARLEGELQGVLALVTDLSDGRGSFILSGPAARERLAASCPLDLRDSSFPVDAAARSLLGEAGLFLARLPDAEGHTVYRLVVDQTAAPYAARMIGLP
jgi:sarcosine oxidase subunit gamma